jgi:hypothetical protein
MIVATATPEVEAKPPVSELAMRFVKMINKERAARAEAEAKLAEAMAGMSNFRTRWYNSVNQLRTERVEHEQAKLDAQHLYSACAHLIANHVVYTDEAAQMDIVEVDMGDLERISEIMGDIDKRCEQEYQLLREEAGA